MKALMSLVLLLGLTCSANAKLTVGSTLSEVEFSGKNGARLDGSKWSSKELNGKVQLIFYVDPDEKDTNNETSEALDKEGYSRVNYASNAIINLAATWLPNFAIESALKKKQEKYPHTLYLKDYKKTLVKTWKLEDDASNIILLDPKGVVLFHEFGKLSKEKIQDLIKLIHSEIAKFKK